MNPKTYFTVDNKRQLEQMYNEHEHQFDQKLEDLLSDFDKGVKTLECNEFSVIKLRNEVNPSSNQIPNPFHSAKEKGAEEINVDFEKVEPKQKPKRPNFPSNRIIKEGKAVSKPKQKENLLDARRERIDIIIDTIGLNVETQLLTKLIEVFDLEANFEDKVQINQMLELRDN